MTTARVDQPWRSEYIRALHDRGRSLVALPTEDDVARVAAVFWPQVDKSANCWIWRGRRTPRGYGEFHIYAMTERFGLSAAHRVSWWLERSRPLRADLLVCHHCDNPECVRPSHLFLGTHKDNSQDMGRKIRSGDLVRVRRQLLRTRT